MTEFLYSGEQFDSKIGQQYLRQRYYDPAIGRFNRIDPFFGIQIEPLSFHKYLYAHNDPTNNTDPSGEFIPVLIAVLGALTGLAAGSLFNIWAFGNNKSDGSLLGNINEYSNMIGLGIAQGWTNTFNGLQDIFAGLYNAFAGLNNIITFPSNIVIRGLSMDNNIDLSLPYIVEEDWDWSKDLFFPESDQSHGWSKWFGGSGLMTALTAGAAHIWVAKGAPTMKIAIGKGQPFHVAYETNGTWMHGEGIKYADMTLEVLPETTFTAWEKVSKGLIQITDIPIASPTTAAGTTGTVEQTCVTATGKAFLRGWYIIK